MFLINTLTDVLALVAQRDDHEAVRWQQPDGTWKPISGSELHRDVQALASIFAGWGVRKGDRVALLTENRWEWLVIDMATLALGALDVPLYATITAEHVGYMVRDAGAKVLFVSSVEQLSKVRQAGEMPALEHIVLLDNRSEPGIENFATLLESARDAVSPEGVPRAGGERVEPSDPATIIYTSGTTGDPKGVVLTHGNFASNLNVSTADFVFTEDDSSISFLPLSHVTARHVDYALLCHGATLAYLPRIDRLPDAMKAVRPSVFVAVPRVYEKIRQGVEGRAGASPLRAKLFRWALRVGERSRGATEQGRPRKGLLIALADRVVFSKLRAAFGGRVKLFIAGGAPLGIDTTNWFADAGIRILEGYGLTETSPVIALNTPRASRAGSVGRPLPNLETRFASDHELEVRGPSVFREYWGREKETAEAFTDDGWFRTGDIGKQDAEGFITITDRKKELLKTSGGKFIAPQPLENQLKANAMVGNAAVFGDGQKYAAVLIAPNFATLEPWAKNKGIVVGDRRDLVRDGQVRRMYQGIVDAVNAKLAPYETMKKMALVPDDWTVESGELTPSMKLKRRVITSQYAEQIKSLFQG